MQEAAVGKLLIFGGEPSNVVDWYAMAVKKDVSFIGHLHVLRKLSYVYSVLLWRGGILWYI